MINTVLQWHGWHLCCFVAKFVQHNLRCFVFCRDTYFVAIYTLSMWRQIRPKILSVEKNDKYDICILVIQTLVELERERRNQIVYSWIFMYEYIQLSNVIVTFGERDIVISIRAKRQVGEGGLKGGHRERRKRGGVAMEEWGSR